MAARMAVIVFLLTTLAWPSPATGQSSPAQEAPPKESQEAPLERKVSILAGAGNAMGWLGVQGERYLWSGRWSLFGGVGYLPSVEPGDSSGAAVAAGVRAFTGGRNHRAFVEASASLVGVETVKSGATVLRSSRLYGPGVQVGYQYVRQDGFTGLASIGVGLGIGAIPEGLEQGCCLDSALDIHGEGDDGAVQQTLRRRRAAWVT